MIYLLQTHFVGKALSFFRRRKMRGENRANVQLLKELRQLYERIAELGELENNASGRRKNYRNVKRGAMPCMIQ